MPDYSVLIFVALVAFLIFKFRHANKVFLIRVKPGKVRILKGTVSKRLVEDTKQIMRKQRVKGDIWGGMVGNEIRVYFSGGVDESFRQRFRNIFPYDSYKIKNNTNPNGGGRDRKIRKAK